MQRVDISNFKNKKIAMVLSGGVVKAASWHIGVALALEELGFTFKHNKSNNNSQFEISTYVGSSAGALMSVFFASGIGPQDIINSMLSKDYKKLRPITYKDMRSRLNQTFLVHLQAFHLPLDVY
jgi:predicted acylesterase/phospholipase RssA